MVSSFVEIFAAEITDAISTFPFPPLGLNRCACSFSFFISSSVTYEIKGSIGLILQTY
jgi:hypothetical protein